MSTSLVFHNPKVLWLLLALPLLVAWWMSEGRSRAVFRFSSTGPLAASGPGWRVHCVRLLPLLRLAAVGLVILALARPQERDEKARDLSVEGIDIVIALDLSTSMEAGDFRPHNRVYVAKQVLTEFLESRTNDRIGLVVFAGAAYTQSPLTLDYAVLKELVKQLRTRVLEDGTAIGDALAISLNRLRDSDAKSRVVVLITDGDNNAGRISPMDAAAMAKALRVPVFTILVGKGGKVPFPAGQDLFGNTAWREHDIPVNPGLLQEISKMTGGEFYRATDREELKGGLQKVLDAMERSKILEGGVMTNYRERFQQLLLLAFGLAWLELFLRSTWLRIFP